MDLLSVTRAKQTISMDGSSVFGCMMKRTCGLASEPNGSIRTACSADVRAPVSTFALMAGRPRSGKATYSSKPKGYFGGSITRSS